MWFVVKFLEEDTVEAVPKGWCDKETMQCYWPPAEIYKIDKVRKMIETEAAVRDDWKLHRVAVLGTYEQYCTALKKAKKAMSTSDLSSSDKPSTRKRKRNWKFVESSSEDGKNGSTSSDDGNTYPASTHLFEATRSLKKKPLFFRTRSKSLSPPRTRPLLKTTLPELVQLDNTINAKSFSPPRSTPKSRAPLTTNLPDISYASERDNNNQSYLRQESEPRVELVSGKTACQGLNDADFKKLVLVELTHLHLKVNTLLENQGTLLQSARNISDKNDLVATQSHVQFLYEKLPVRTALQLKEVEDWLSADNERYVATVKEFRRVGGHSYSQATRKLLYRTFANEVAMEYSWEGAKKKFAFKDLAVARCILESIKSEYVTVSETAIIAVIKIWLVKAKQRLEQTDK